MLTPRSALYACTICVLAATIERAEALQLAEEMTCEQAIQQFEQTGVVYVFANGRFVIPFKRGTPVRKAANLQCPDQGAIPRAFTVTTRDARRCVISMGC